MISLNFVLRLLLAATAAAETLSTGHQPKQKERKARSPKANGSSPKSETGPDLDRVLLASPPSATTLTEEVASLSTATTPPTTGRRQRGVSSSPDPLETSSGLAT